MDVENEKICVLIAGTGGGGTGTYSLQGQVDDVAIYNEALTADELLRNFNAGKRSHR